MSTSPISGFGPYRFHFRFEERYRVASRAFGVTPQNSWVELDAGMLNTRFGRWWLRTPVTNIASWSITGPYSYLKTAGPARLAITDRGLTFATNGERGLAICFHQPVKGMEPLGVLRHPELTVTVDRPEELAKCLEREHERIRAASS